MKCGKRQEEIGEALCKQWDLYLAEELTKAGEPVGKVLLNLLKEREIRNEN